jgi:hypothetical protein
MGGKKRGDGDDGEDGEEQYAQRYQEERIV